MTEIEASSTAPRSTKAGSVQNARITSLQNKMPSDLWQQYIYPNLSKIPAIMDSVLAKVPTLNIPNNQLIELSSHLKSIKNFVIDARFDAVGVSILQEKCTNEWNDFNTLVTQIVKSDKKQNVIDFCAHQTDSLSMILSSIHSAFDKNQDQNFTVNGRKVSRKTVLAQLQKIDEKFEEVKTKLTENMTGIQTTLKNLSRTISESSNVFSCCPSVRDENELYQTRLKQGISTMLQYIQNSNEATEARRRFQTLSTESNKEMQDAFSTALKEETKISQIQVLEDKEKLTNVTSSITNNDVSAINTDSSSTIQKNKEPRKKLQQVKSHSPPKHTPVSRPKLYEERRTLSAVGSLRAKPTTSKP